MKKFKWLVLGVLLVVFCVGCYIIYENNTKKDSSKDDALDNLNNVALELQSFVSDNSLDSLDLYGMDNLDRVAINYYCFKEDKCDTVSKDEVDDYLNKVFKMTSKHTDILCRVDNEVLYKFDGENFIYNEDHPGHDGDNATSIYSKVYSISQSGDKYVLVLKKIYYSPLSSDYITSDPQNNNKLFEDSLFGDEASNEEIIDYYNEHYDEFKNKGNKYKYTFEKNGDSFYLKDYKVI